MLYGRGVLVRKEGNYKDTLTKSLDFYRPVIMGHYVTHNDYYESSPWLIVKTVSQDTPNS